MRHGTTSVRSDGDLARCNGKSALMTQLLCHYTIRSMASGVRWALARRRTLGRAVHIEPGGERDARGGSFTAACGGWYAVRRGLVPACGARAYQEKVETTSFRRRAMSASAWAERLIVSVDDAVSAAAPSTCSLTAAVSLATVETLSTSVERVRTFIEGERAEEETLRLRGPVTEPALRDPKRRRDLRSREQPLGRGRHPRGADAAQGRLSRARLRAGAGPRDCVRMFYQSAARPATAGFSSRRSLSSHTRRGRRWPRTSFFLSTRFAAPDPEEGPR